MFDTDELDACPICYETFDHAPGCPVGAEWEADEAEQETQRKETNMSRSKKETKLREQRRLKGRRNRPSPQGRKLVKGVNTKRVRGPGRRHKNK